MAEQTVDKPTPPPGGPASTPAAGTAPTGELATMQAYLDAHPEAATQLQLKAKVNGEERPVALAALQTSYQLESAARQKLEAAALKEKELAAREAALAEKGDPNKALERALRGVITPPTPPGPLDGLDSPESFYAEGARVVPVVRNLMNENQRLAVDAKAKEQRLAELEQRQKTLETQQANVWQWTRLKEEFDDVRRQTPDFTARVVVKTDGTFALDEGSNPAVMREVLYLKRYGEIPDPRFNNQVPKTLSYAELTAGIEKAEQAKYDARKVAAERKHQESLRASVTSVSPATGAIEIPSDLIDLPGDSKEEIRRKAEARGELIRERARAAGLKVT